MEDCEILDLIQIEGRFHKFVVETKNELNVLEHIASCSTCRARIHRDLSQGKDTFEFGNVFKKIVYESNIPDFKDFENLDNFINARIKWRKEKLLEVLDSAEIELKFLRSEIAN
jgi:hypothetical protein